MDEKRRNVWYAMRKTLFDDGVLDKVFAHARNLAVASFILGVGMYAVQAGDSLEIASMLSVQWSGYVVATVGVTLLVLNLIDGLYRLSTLKRHLLLQILLMALYVFVSVRMTQLFIAFRG